MAKIGVVGCGYWGAKHVRSLHDLGGDEIVVCDPDLRRLANLQRKYPGIAAYERIDEVLESDVKAVIIATPMASHFDLARRCLLADKDVLVEKPLTTSFEHAVQLVQLAEERRAVLMVGHTFLYNPAVESVLDLIASGELGEIYYINLSRLNLGLFQQDSNVLWDLAPHDLSILLYLLGRFPLQISATGAAHLNPRVCDNAYLDLIFSHGTHAHVHVSWLEPRKVRRATVVGTRKMVVYDDVAATDKVWVYDKGINLHYQTDEFEDFHLSYRYGNTTILHTPPDEPLQLEQKHFIGCTKERRRPKSDGFAGLHVVALLEAAQRSLDYGGQPLEVEPLVDSPDPNLGSGLERIAQIKTPRWSPANAKTSTSMVP